MGYGLEIDPSTLDIVNIEEARALGKLGEVTAAALIRGREMNGLDFDIGFFRQGLFRYYTCSKKFPLTFDEFQQTTFDISDADSVTLDSAAKCTKRRVFRNDPLRLSIAQTISDGEVRETEIILTDNRRDSQLDFVTYGADGQLVDRSQFPTHGGTTAVAAAPSVCLTCHVAESTAGTLSYENMFPNQGICSSQ